MKSIEEYPNKEIGKSCSLLRRKNIVKISIFPKVINRFDAIPFKAPIILLREIKRLLKII